MELTFGCFFLKKQVETEGTYTRHGPNKSWPKHLCDWSYNIENTNSKVNAHKLEWTAI